eukprot:836179-Rhodomonas_salina.1
MRLRARGSGIDCALFQRRRSKQDRQQQTNTTNHGILELVRAQHAAGRAEHAIVGEAKEVFPSQNHRLPLGPRCQLHRRASCGMFHAVQSWACFGFGECVRCGRGGGGGGRSGGRRRRASLRRTRPGPALEDASTIRSSTSCPHTKDKNSPTEPRRYHRHRIHTLIHQHTRHTKHQTHPHAIINIAPVFTPIQLAHGRTETCLGGTEAEDWDPQERGIAFQF